MRDRDYAVHESFGGLVDDEFFCVKKMRKKKKEKGDLYAVHESFGRLVDDKFVMFF